MFPVLTVYRRAPSSLRGVIPEIDIWRAAYLVLRLYGDNAEVESARRADELWDDGGSGRCISLAAHHRCHRAAHEYDASRAGPLTRQCAAPAVFGGSR